MPKKATAKKTSVPKAAKGSKDIKKDAKIDKKAAAAVKKPEPKEKKVAAKAAKPAPKGKAAKNGKKLLELGLLCDCTSSMHSWIDRAKKTLLEIISNVVSSTDNLDVRVSFIGYRDHCDSERFSIQPFSNDITKVRDFIANVRAMGGGDLPEDVVGGLRKCLDQDWTAGSSR